MTGKRLNLWASIIILMLASSRLWASDFDAGVQAFKAQDYAQAIVYFEQAQAQGIDSPVLHYNLAVSYFKQQRYDQAKQSFELAAQQDTLAAISYYNLGLVALKKAQLQTAKQAFKESFTLADDERLKLLSARQLEKLLPSTKQKEVAPKRLSGFASLGWVHDSNVRQVNDDLPTVNTEADSYLDLFVLTSYQLTGSRRQGLQLKAGFIVNRYQTLSNYNQQTLNLGIYFSAPLAGWQGRIGLHAYRDKLDGQPYLKRLVTQVRGDNYYADGQRFQLRYELSQYQEGDVKYAYLAGNKHRFQMTNRSRFGAEELQFGYKLEVNDRDDLTLANSFISVSPIRQTVSFKWRHNVNRVLASELTLDYRSSDYRDNNVINGVGQVIQKEQRSRIAATGIYRLNKQTELEARWRYTSNDANVANERYINHQIMMSANLYF